MKPENVALLRQALPYINRFKGKTFVIKIGGEVAHDHQHLYDFCEEVALCSQVGIRVVVVHGGGKQATDMSEKLGIEAKMINGRRVTDENTLDIAKMVYAGKINVEILSSLRKAGIATVGLSGVDGNLISARRRPPKKVVNQETGHEEWIDFGHVGDIEAVNTRVLELLLDGGFLPVVSSLGDDGEGHVLNINADTVAANLARELGAEKLILASNVEGIMNEGKLVSRLSEADVADYLERGIIKGGMIPKTQEALAAMRAGVSSVHIISGLQSSTLLTEVFTDSGCGTMLFRNQP